MRSINGVEEPLEVVADAGLTQTPAQLLEHGLSATLAGFAPRAFALRSGSPRPSIEFGEALQLNFDLKVTQARGAADRGFDGRGTAYPEEAFPEGRFEDGGLAFELARRGDPNALRADGQCLTLPAASRRVAVLCASLRRLDAIGVWRGDGLVEATRWVVPHWRWRRGLEARIDDPAVAWNSRHLRRRGADLVYEFGCLHRVELEAPLGATTLWLPRERHLAIFAVTTSPRQLANWAAFSSLYDGDPCPD